MKRFREMCSVFGRDNDGFMPIDHWPVCDDDGYYQEPIL
jgi:hypothetical protein